MTPLLRKFLGMNWLLVIVMYLILVTSVPVISSAARHLSQGGEWFAERQKIWILLGTVAFFGAALVNYKWIKFLALPMYLGGIVLTLLAKEADNNVHQLEFGGVAFQPVPFMIAAGIISIATVMQLMRKGHWLLQQPLVQLAVVGLVAGIPFVLVVKTGDMGSAIVWIPVTVSMLLVGGLPFRYFIFSSLVAAALLPVVYFFVLPEVSERGHGRIELWIDRLQGNEVDIQNEGYAAHYVTLNVGQAGWEGDGLNEATDSLHAKKLVPFKTAHNDFIFAIFAGELGFRGALLLITAYGLLLIQGLFIAYYSGDTMGRLIATGVVALFAAHIFENIGMCVDLMPITGIPLPLFSYSGTFALMCMFLLGLCQSIWVHRYSVREEPEEAAV